MQHQFLVFRDLPKCFPNESNGLGKQGAMLRNQKASPPRSQGVISPDWMQLHLGSPQGKIGWCSSKRQSQRGRNRTPFPTYKRFWCHICTISIYNLLVSLYMLLSLLQIDVKRVSRQHKKTSSLVPTLQPKRLAKLVQRSTLVKHLFLPFGNFYFATFCAEISDVEIETLKPGPTQPLNLWMLQNFSCSILQNKLRNIRIVLVPRCQNATGCVAIALHLIPTAKVACRAKGWRTSEHTTSTAKMILLKSTSSGLFTVTSSRCFWIFLE